jgi:hypothetical protein
MEMSNQTPIEKVNFMEQEAERLQYSFPEWRKGQALFNVVYCFYPEIANEIRGSEFDCFHVDERIELFKRRVLELLKESANHET